jgi:hypothetical protein
MKVMENKFGKNEEKLHLSNLAGGNIKCCAHFEKHIGGSSNSYHMIQQLKPCWWEYKMLCSL